MGGLTPGATYIYERVGDQVYARESGSLQRRPVGGLANTVDMDYWRKLVETSWENPDLREALERAIMIYEMGFGDNGQTIDTE